MNRNEVVDKLNSLPDRAAEMRGEDSIWIKCPYHKNGQENTPSLKVNLQAGQYAIGSWRCFGCSPPKSGSWAKLAVKLGLRKKGDEDDEPYAAELPTSLLKRMLEDESEDTNTLHEKLAKEPLIQVSQTWRGIQGWLLNELQARVSMLSSNGTATNYTRVYLPISVHGKWRGGIFCSWDENTGLKYENEKMESQELLFPYDWVRSKLLLLPKKKRKCLFVEGPRDALNMCQHGIVALGNLGGDTVWSDAKAELLQELDLEVLVNATDPDLVGNRLAKRVRRSLTNVIPVIKRFKMSITYSESGRVLTKEDPGNLSYPRIQYLKEQMEGF